MKDKKRKVTDPDLRQIEPALRRAAARAREIARKTGTAIIVYEDGKIVRKLVEPEPGQ